MWTVWSTTGDRTEHRKNRPVMCVGRRKNKTQTHQKMFSHKTYNWNDMDHH